MAEALTTTLKMKDLETLTGVSREAIHFYLREGLLPEPQRPKRNVAYYSDEHVVRIQAIKQLQQERSLSLDAIRKVLLDFDYDALRTGDSLTRFETTVQSHVNGTLPAHNQSLNDVSTRTGLEPASLQELHDMGVIQIVQSNAGAELSTHDVAIVELWAKLLSLGYGGRQNYDNTYLKRFVDVLAPLAEIEVSNFLDEFGDDNSDAAAQLAAQGISITNEIFGRLRTQAILRALHEKVDLTEPDE